MGLKPVAVTIHLLTLRGYLMQRELANGLGRLACTEDECWLHVAETTDTANKRKFEALLKCRRSLNTEGLWVVKGHDSTHTTYHATFDEIESASTIVEAVRRILDTPILYPQR
jgi:hypothetical protein